MRVIDADKLPLNKIDDANYGSNYIRIAPTVEAIPKADYENRLKADMVAMLEELKKEIVEITISKATVPDEIFWNMGADAMKKEIGTRIQEKINSLKENKDAI